MLTLLLGSLLVPAAGGGNGKLEILHVRPTYGYLGAVRPKEGMLPGDIAHVSFDIKGLKTDGRGRAAYSVAIEIRDDKGDLLYEQKPINAVAQNYFGGDTLPCSATIDVPVDAKPGVRNWKVTVEDRTTKQSVSLEGKGEVLKPRFGLIRVGTFADPEGRVPVPPVGVTGSTLYLDFSAVSFARDPKTKQPDLQVELRVKDDKGQTTFTEPLSGRVKEDVPESLNVVPMQFPLTLNRPGRFTVELSARCVLCGATTTVTIPVRILPME
jgi:hypothetical protein